MVVFCADVVIVAHDAKGRVELVALAVVDPAFTADAAS